MIEMVNVRTPTLFKEGRGNSMVANGSASRRTDVKGFVGALSVNPEYPIRKQDEHKKHVVENIILRGNLADNDDQTRLLEGKIQSLKHPIIYMADLLGRRSDSRDAISQDFQDEMKKMTDLLKRIPQTHRMLMFQLPNQSTSMYLHMGHPLRMQPHWC